MQILSEPLGPANEGTHNITCDRDVIIVKREHRQIKGALGPCLQLCRQKFVGASTLQGLGSTDEAAPVRIDRHFWNHIRKTKAFSCFTAGMREWDYLCSVACRRCGHNLACIDEGYNLMSNGHPAWRYAGPIRRHQFCNQS